MTLPQLAPMPGLDRVSNRAPERPSRSTLTTRDVNSYFRSIPSGPPAMAQTWPRLPSPDASAAFFPIPGASSK